MKIPSLILALALLTPSIGCAYGPAGDWHQCCTYSKTLTTTS